MQVRVIWIVLLLLCALTVRSQEIRPQKIAEEYYRLGEVAFKKGDWMQAASYYDSCLFINTTHFDAHFSRAIARENTGNFAGAINDYSVLIHLNPTMTEFLWNRAILYYQMEHYNLANEDLYDLLKLPEAETNAVYFKQSYPDGGVSSVATLKTMKSQIYNYLGLIAYEKNQIELAIKHYNRAIELDPRNPDVLVNRSQAYEATNEPERAEADLKSALILDPRYSLARYHLARLQEMNASHTGLIETYNTIIMESPEFSEAYAKRGLAKMNSGDLYGALADYDFAILYGSGDPVLWMNRGIIKLRTDNLSGAYSDLSKAVEMRYDLENAWLNRGNVLMKMKRYEDAIHDYDIAIMYYPEFAMAYYNRGVARYNVRENESACRDIEKALALGMKKAEHTLQKMCR